MTPREQMRKMTALGEQDDKHWYRLVNSMSVGELRQRQEIMMRNQMTLNPQVLAQSQQRLQLDPRFIDRDLVPPPEIISSSESRHLAPALPPPPSVLTGRPFNAPGGYGFLPPESMETVARRQEILHKQSMARMEMNAILQQKELESHQKSFVENPVMFQHLGSSPAVFRGCHRLQDGHDVFDLHANSFLMSGGPYPPVSALHRERARRHGRRAVNQKGSDGSVATFQSDRIQAEEKSVDESSGGASGEEKELQPEGRAEDVNANKEQVGLAASGGRKSYKNGEPAEACGGAQTGRSDIQKDVTTTCATFQEKFLYTPTPLSTLPYMLPHTLLPPVSQMFLNSADSSAIEDLCKWTVEDVYNFISNIPNCSEHAQVFKDHLIDGETLPLLTEDHLLDTLGLKLGPALKIRSQVLRRMGGTIFGGRDLTLSTLPLQQPMDKRPDRSSDIASPLTCGADFVQALPPVNDRQNVKQAESQENHGET